MLRSIATIVVALFSFDVSMASAQPAAGTEAVDTEYSDIPSPFDNAPRRRMLGYGRLTSNDLIGDGKDRWRTGSVTSSRVFGYDWSGVAPSRPFEMLELRLQGQIIAPDNLQKVNLSDRPYAGVLSLGLHSRSSWRGLDMSLGADLVVIGPQTNLDQLQKSLHRLFKRPVPADSVLALQLRDRIRPTAVAELGRRYELGDAVTFRPFAEARAGDETLLRAGVDFTFGSVTRGELLSRESITGQRYRVIYRSGPGVSFTLGGDIARVTQSVYLPPSRGYGLVSRRERLRVGVHWQGENASAFYGLTWLGREFAGQPEGQVIGSARIKLRF